MGFEERVSAPDLKGIVTHAGFVAGAEKKELLRDSDCLCFPTYYELESFGLVVIEAMAAGLNVLTTRWRALPEILPPNYIGFVPVRDAQAIAQMIPRLFTEDSTMLRAAFLARFTDRHHIRTLHEALIALSPSS